MKPILSIKKQIIESQNRISYYQYFLWNEFQRLHYLQNQLYLHNQRSPRQREFTLGELSTYDGAQGRPAYVAVNGIVYDVSLEATWGGGTHFGLTAGKDLTEQFKGCHGESILEKLPKVGILKP